MHYVEKIPNGKLVAMDVTVSDEKVTSMKITGDFFLHPEELITQIEAAFLGISPSMIDSELHSRIYQVVRDAELVGVSVEDFVRIFKKAVAK